MVDRTQILRLDGRDHDADPSSLLVHGCGGEIEVVVTEERGADAVVVLSREQARALARALLESVDASR